MMPASVALTRQTAQRIVDEVEARRRYLLAAGTVDVDVDEVLSAATEIILRKVQVGALRVEQASFSGTVFGIVRNTSRNVSRAARRRTQHEHAWADEQSTLAPAGGILDRLAERDDADRRVRYVAELISAEDLDVVLQVAAADGTEPCGRQVTRARARVRAVAQTVTAAMEFAQSSDPIDLAAVLGCVRSHAESAPVVPHLLEQLDTVDELVSTDARARAARSNAAAAYAASTGRAHSDGAARIRTATRLARAATVVITAEREG